MNPYYNKHGITVYCGDLREVLPHLDVKVDHVVTDPPYGLSFMGKGWDAQVPGSDFWERIGEVCKPGSMLLSFGGTRTWHRLACAIEYAGWEIRDTLMWLFGQGFPKCGDIGKLIDKSGGCGLPKDDRLAFAAELRQKREVAGLTRAALAARFPQYKEITKNWERTDVGFRVPNEVDYQKLVDRLGISESWRSKIRAEDKRRCIENVSIDRRDDGTVYALAHDGSRYESTTDAAQPWIGRAMVLKPAWEPIILAMKPLDGTVANNALVHGVAGLNIDACRIGTEKRFNPPAGNKGGTAALNMGVRGMPQDAEGREAIGRWPANVLLDEETAAQLDAQAGVGKSRFFYVGKTTKKERSPGNDHSTVKPLDLMKYLVMLLAPPGGGLLLDPFAGSGTTLLAAKTLGQKCIGVELDPHYCEIIASRLEAAA